MNADKISKLKKCTYRTKKYRISFELKISTDIASKLKI